MKKSRSILFGVVKRGLCRRCPQCGEGALFSSWMNLLPECKVCGLKLQGKREEDTWAWMYFSTAFTTGILILGMFLVRPENRILGIIVVVILAFAMMAGTMPFRKGIAIALDYYVELRAGNEEGLSYRPPSK